MTEQGCLRSLNALFQLVFSDCIVARINYYVIRRIELKKTRVDICYIYEVMISGEERAALLIEDDTLPR